MFDSEIKFYARDFNFFNCLRSVNTLRFNGLGTIAKKEVEEKEAAALLEREEKQKKEAEALLKKQRMVMAQ